MMSPLLVAIALKTGHIITMKVEEKLLAKTKALRPSFHKIRMKLKIKEERCHLSIACVTLKSGRDWSCLW